VHDLLGLRGIVAHAALPVRVEGELAAEDGLVELHGFAGLAVEADVGVEPNGHRVLPEGSWISDRKTAPAGRTHRGCAAWRLHRPADVHVRAIRCALSHWYVPHRVDDDAEPGGSA
jgi:hypothetical protein